MMNSAAVSRLFGSASRAAQVGVRGSLANDVGADRSTDMASDLAVVPIGVRKPAHASGAAGGEVVRAGQLLRAVDGGLMATQRCWSGLPWRGVSVNWAATRMLSHASVGDHDRCGNWRAELRQRERDLDLACQQEVARWLQLNRAIELACPRETVDEFGLRPSTQTGAQWGSGTRLDVWLDDLDQLLKARHTSHRRLSFLQREHDNIRLTLSAFERTSTAPVREEQTGLSRPNRAHQLSGLAGDQGVGGVK